MEAPFSSSSTEPALTSLPTTFFYFIGMEKDKDKSHYLGNSIKNATGLWAKRKGDLEWFTKDKANPTGPASVELDEIAEIKRKEAEAMAQALGATNPVSGSNEYDQHVNEMIKKELQEKSTTYQGEKIVGLGMQGSSRRDVVMATKRAYREEERERGRSWKSVAEPSTEAKKGLDDERRKRDKKDKKKRTRSRSRSRSRERKSDRRDREGERRENRDRRRSRSRSRERDRHRREFY